MCMYFFRKKSASGATLQLLEAYRNGDGQPRTRVVASLGDVDYDEETRSAVAREVEDRLYERESLFPATGKAAEIADRVVGLVRSRNRWRPLSGSTATAPDTGGKRERAIVVDGVLVDAATTENSVSLGPELVALQAWRELGMDERLRTLKFNAAQVRAACSQVVGRLTRPGSERALQGMVLPASALPELLEDVALPTPTSLDRLYRISDKLVANRDAIESWLRERTGRVFGLTRNYYLYDLTNSHFEGVCAENPKARRGRSKQKRHDCPLITAGVCFDEHGFILFHKTFAGNVGEASTLPGIIAEMRRCVEADPEDLFKSLPTVLVDGGLATKANLEALRQAGIGYLVNRTRSFRARFETEFAQVGSFLPVPGRAANKEVLVRAVKPGEATAELSDELPEGDVAVLCRSAARGEKESAMRSRAEDRLIKDLERLAARIAAGRLKKPEKIQEKIGRLRERHSRAARFYRIEAVDGGLSYSRLDGLDQAEGLDGCYVLQTNLAGLQPDELWSRYVVLEKAEAGFRSIKHDCGLRPNYHRVEHRVDGHVFISVLAYQLMRYLCFKLERAGDRRSWVAIRSILETHRYVTMNLPCRDGTLWRSRRAGRPDSSQRAIYAILGVNLEDVPKRIWMEPAPKNEN